MAQTGINKQTRVVLFDHDGTLIDSESVHFRLWQHVLDNYDVVLNHAFHDQKMAGIPVDQNAVDLVEHLNLSVPASQLAKEKHALTREFLNEQAFPLMPDAASAVQQVFEQGYTIGIVTGGSRQSVDQTLSQHGFDKWISVVVAVEDVAQSKPAPDCYLQALSKLGISAEQAVSVEDTMYGMQASLSAHIPCVVIPTPNSAAHDFTGAAARYDSLTQWLQAEL